MKFNKKGLFSQEACGKTKANLWKKTLFFVEMYSYQGSQKSYTGRHKSNKKLQYKALTTKKLVWKRKRPLVNEGKARHFTKSKVCYKNRAMNTQWDIIYKKLQQKLGEKVCEVWILPLLVNTKDKNLHLIASNHFTADWVRSNFTSSIEDAMRDSGLTALHIDVIDPSKKQEDKSLDDLAPQNIKNSHNKKAEKNFCGRANYNQLAIEEGPNNRATLLPLPLSNGSFAENFMAWRHDFDSFVVGSSNELAYAAAKTMIKNTRAVDTLFLSSASGLGKTHLTHAVGKALCEVSNRSRPRVAYLTAERFATSFVQAMQNRTIEDLKGRFRDVDILLFEDIQFLQNKPKMQEELLSTIKSLQDSGSRVVLTSAFAPKELKNVDDQLVSRFASGFLANIEKPDSTMRARILMEKARQHNMNLPLSIAHMLAEKLCGDIRQLESLMHTLVLRAGLLDLPISEDLAKEVLEQYCEKANIFDLDSIVQHVSKAFDLSFPQLASRSRKQEHVLARNTIFYLARKHTDISLEDLGARFNRRHSTVIKGIDTIERALHRQSSLGRQVEHCISFMNKQ